MPMPAPLTVTTPNDTDVVVVRSFDAPRSLVFDAHTKPELVKRWLLGPPGWTMPTCEIDLRVGGKYRYGWAHPEREGFEIVGEFREIARPARIVHTEEFRPGGQKMPGADPAVDTTVFTESAGKTTMTVTMRFPSKEARDGAVATGMTGGMEQSYQNLDQMLAAKAVA
jgi:uncharacterized protein YndB with AHSA1/START domain